MPPIIEAVATEGRGATGLWDAIGDHQGHLRATGELDGWRRRRWRDELASVVTEQVRQRAAELLAPDGLARLIDRVQVGEVAPNTAADDLLGPLGA